MKREFTKEECQKIYSEARKYLLDFDEINEDILEKHLDNYKIGAATSIEELLKKILNSVKNKQAMPNTIGDIDKLGPYLCDFNPKQIITVFENNWEKVFYKIKNEYKPKGKFDINKPQSYWVIFCKSVISAANFVNKFSNIEEFNIFVEKFYLNEYTRVALPLLLQREIKGFGFALACDFLKENGYEKFVKPDVHIKYIFNGIGLSDSDDDYEIFKDVIRFAESINEVPYCVDKLFWLIGSGNFYLREPPLNKKRIRTDSDQFIKRIKNVVLAK